MSNTNNSQVFFNWIAQKEMFHELILAQDGCIYPAIGIRNAANWSCVYYNGNVCVHRGDSMYCVGSLPEETLFLPTVVGDTGFYNIEDSSCLLHSMQPVLENGISVFAVFRYKDILALYMADSMVSKAIYFSLTEYTPEEEVFNNNLFHRMLRRHDLEAAEKVAGWLNRHGAHGGEV